MRVNHGAGGARIWHEIVGTPDSNVHSIDSHSNVPLWSITHGGVSPIHSCAAFQFEAAQMWAIRFASARVIMQIAMGCLRLYLSSASALVKVGFARNLVSSFSMVWTLQWQNRHTPLWHIAIEIAMGIGLESDEISIVKIFCHVV